MSTHDKPPPLAITVKDGRVEQDIATAVIQHSAEEVDRMYMEEANVNDKPKPFELSDIAQTRDDLIAHFDKQKEIAIYHAESLQTAEYALVKKAGWKSPALLTFGFDIFSADRTMLSQETSLVWFEDPTRTEASPSTPRSDHPNALNGVVALFIRGRTLVIRHWSEFASDPIRADTIHFNDGVEQLQEHMCILGLAWRTQIGWIGEQE